MTAADIRKGFIDTHAHLDGKEFDGDRDEVIQRARDAGVSLVMIPAIDLASVRSVLAMCRRYRGYALPMIGLHPEEVRDDWREVLDEMYAVLRSTPEVTAIGETGLDFYWSREYERQQTEAFETQVEWSVTTRLPLMIHCRKAQNEMVKILRRHERDLPGGVFHCFTGNAREACELLSFDRFVLGIGGVLTFNKSRLPEVIASSVPIDRIVLETDSPYMAPVPVRGRRNESAFVRYVLDKTAECYGISPEEVAAITTDNVKRVFGI